MRIVLLSLAAALAAHAQWTHPNPVIKVERQPDAVLFTLKEGALRVQICTNSILRTTQSPTASIPDTQQYVVNRTEWPATKWDLQQNDKTVTVSTDRMRVAVSRADATLAFADADGRSLVQEGPNTLTPTTVNGEKTWRAEAFIGLWGSTEAFYGLGQHQSGVWNYHGELVDMAQDNTNISVPVLLSSSGYGIFWNNTSRSRFNNRFVHAMYITSEAADAIDYYFLYGPDFDRIIAGYRELTGAAPMFGKWAYGFWQCKNRYKAQEEILGVARKYRELHIPVDNIVQDWFWWTRMGDFQWNKDYPDPKAMVDELHRRNFHLMVSVWPFFEKGSPTYEEMDKLGYFVDRTIAPTDFHPLGTALYDAFNPKARQYMWNLMNKALFQIGVDAWWFDTTEPETEAREDNILVRNKVALGNGARYVNMYPLMATTAAYEGQRSTSDDKRVYILSRSAFAGSQRNSVTAWSGDVDCEWYAYRRQIPAGLNFSLSGLPYWTTDIGGFVTGNPDDPAYRELFVRWFQFGTFSPIMRVHGTRTTNQNELWSYGSEAQKILTNFDRLRYELLPYIYSIAWKTTTESYTPMRPLVMDFRTDVHAQNIGDQFLFGPAILVNPVTEPGAATRHLYLPKAQWYDFWTGKTTEGGRSVDAPVTLATIPLYVRAGSIVPMGPDVEYAAEKPADPIELRVYRGTDGAFTLYEDEGDSYRYEKGVHATIPIQWNQSSSTLSIGARQGEFPGMLRERTFRVVFVRDGHGAGIGAEHQADQEVRYTGSLVTVRP
jgi:alpha-D-xyloside xylohydrolase